uniref:uncharacterized protein LOC100186429 n=1 Tax=Ciona intestinalis TaxID=7719 RepID=UPI000180B345|nr:uncharacterized protein LOC100186429 [Ciona intestinalis]|eukprot:XP_002128597.1 uncharacterized protein LOC100186429 [Ciona intestinalis]
MTHRRRKSVWPSAVRDTTLSNKLSKGPKLKSRSGCSYKMDSNRNEQPQTNTTSVEQEKPGPSTSSATPDQPITTASSPPPPTPPSSIPGLIPWTPDVPIKQYLFDASSHFALIGENDPWPSMGALCQSQANPTRHEWYIFSEKARTTDKPFDTFIELLLKTYTKDLTCALQVVPQMTPNPQQLPSMFLRQLISQFPALEIATIHKRLIFQHYFSFFDLSFQTHFGRLDDLDLTVVGEESDRISDDQPFALIRRQDSMSTTTSSSIDTELQADVANLIHSIEQLKVQIDSQDNDSYWKRNPPQQRSNYQRREYSNKPHNQPPSSTHQTCSSDVSLPRNTTSNDDICFYHQRFGDRANKCTSPCNFHSPVHTARSPSTPPVYSSSSPRIQDGISDRTFPTDTSAAASFITSSCTASNQTTHQFFNADDSPIQVASTHTQDNAKEPLTTLTITPS